jgi:putative toxin-antitoxin system antitoxin component (TIGR02293 family)
MPRKVWHNVAMSQTLPIPVVPSPFVLDWKAVEQGVPLPALEEFAASSGFALKDLLEVVIPARTLKHRRQRQEPLSLDESDRLARVARVYALAVRVFGNPEKARRWLSKPKIRFDDQTPLAMLRTDLGGRQVEEMLIQIEEGMFA